MSIGYRRPDYAGYAPRQDMASSPTVRQQVPQAPPQGPSQASQNRLGYGSRYGSPVGPGRPAPEQQGNGGNGYSQARNDLNAVKPQGGNGGGGQPQQPQQQNSTASYSGSIPSNYFYGPQGGNTATPGAQLPQAQAPVPQYQQAPPQQQQPVQTPFGFFGGSGPAAPTTQQVQASPQSYYGTSFDPRRGVDYGMKPPPNPMNQALIELLLYGNDPSARLRSPVPYNTWDTSA